MKRYFLIGLIILSLFGCKEENILDQLSKEPSITVVGQLVYIGNAPFEEAALRIDGINYPLFLAFEDPTLSMTLEHLPQHIPLQAIGHLEKVEKVTADNKYRITSYTLTVSSLERF